MNSVFSPPPAYWAGWALACFYNFSRDIFNASWFLLVFNVVHFAIWALLGLIAIPIIRRFPLRLHWRPWLFHGVLGSLFVIIDITLGHWISYRLFGAAASKSLPEIAIIAFKNCFHLGLLTYWAMLGVVLGLDALKLARVREVQVARHKTAYVRAQLQNLKSQLQPHFLFNTLNAIASFMHYDVPTADRMLNRLSEVLRMSLRESGKPFVTLGQELAFIEAYLEIEKIRFEQRLSIGWEVPAELHGHEIPPFILQPLVENAIKYSVAPRSAGGSVLIRAYADSGQLLLEVEDDAPAEAPQQQGLGIGLANTRARLETLYGVGQRLDLLRAGMGTIARIRIPLHPILAQAA